MDEEKIKNRPLARQILEDACKKEQSRLSTDQVHELADKYKFSRKFLTNFYAEIKNDIKLK